MIILILLTAVAILLFLITFVRLNAFIALTISALSVGFMRGMSLKNILESAQKGIGSTLGGLVLVMGFGVMLGAVLAETGAINQIANKLIAFFGKKNVNIAVLMTSFIVGIVLFYNVGFVVIVPLVFTIAAETSLPLIYLAITMVSALSVTHGFLPPHPGPTAIVLIFKADLGKTLFYGLLLAIPSIIIGGYFFPKFLKNIKAQPPKGLIEIKHFDEKKLPSFLLSLLVALMPIILIGGATLAEFILPKDAPQLNYIKFFGDPSISILLALISGFLFLGVFKLDSDTNWKQRATNLTEKMNRSVAGVALIIFILAAGGAFKQIIQDTGIGNDLAEVFKTLPLSPLLLGWLIAASLRVIIGSSTVAGLTAAGILQPMVALNPHISPELMVLAIGAGSLAFSHVNETGFWMFKEYFGLSLKDTFRSWTAMETIVSFCGLIGVLILNLIII